MRNIINWLKRVRKLWLEINDKDLLKGLRVCGVETQLSNTQNIPKEKETLKVLVVRGTFSSSFLAPGLVQGAVLQMSGGLDNGTFSFEVLRWLAKGLMCVQALTHNALMCIQVLTQD